ncbi:rRNA-processing protein utp23 [Hypsizygus marmoreus]|uniref:U three protein 23 n=1 Tax=Hypsizygus marmoreus TaxID=39966 RepID=A0A369K2R9_HYPMA|nr:rRNA-processing protein utp23 [Hypsizygus marmoreus]
MRQKRAKAYRKLMALYSMKFGFRQPYQVLVDSEMCKSATDLKLELVKQFGTVLQGETKPMITQCCIHELYLQGKLRQSAVDLAKTFERRKCNHREAIPGDECITSVVGPTNKHRYVIATQSQPLRAKLRGIPAVPIVHVNRTVMVLEPPSDVTIETKEAMEEKALHPTAPDLKLVGPSTMTEPVHKKKKGPKGPNPLSIKKKKTAEVFSKDNGKGKAKATGLSKQTPEPAKAGQKRKHDQVEHMHPVPAQDPKSNLVTDDQPRPLKKRRRRKLAQVDAAGSDS